MEKSFPISFAFNISQTIFTFYKKLASPQPLSLARRGERGEVASVILLAMFIVCFFPSATLPQERDTSFVFPDTLITLTAVDTSVTVDTTTRKRFDVDTVIYAAASDSLIFHIKEKKMDIYGEASLQYKETDLKSANIYVDFATSNLEAVGVPADTTLLTYKGTPVLKEGADVYEGIRMKYNFKNKQGYIASAGTESEGAIYTGQKIKKVDEETYFIEDGIYTTCEIDTPHYHFYSPKMKVIHKDQIIAEWIFLNFGGVPFPIPVPFAVFPIESGRRSGLIPPVFGESGQYGRYFSRFGYFWAISDYMDLNLLGDYYTRGSYSARSRFRYAKRYDYTGNLEGEYKKFVIHERTDPDRSERIDWRIKWNHNQNITPTMRLDANLEFLSSDFLGRSVTSYSDLLRNEVVSNATLFKSWEESGNSLSLSYSRRQVLQSGDINEVLPNLTFNMSQKYPFKRDVATGGQRWYELIGYTYSGQFQNNRTKTGGNLQIRGGIQHNISTSASPKIGYFSVTPRISYQERWYNKRIEKEFAGLTSGGKDSIITNDVKEINFLRTFNMGLSASTKFYGIVQPNVLGISAIRHTVNPSISYSYQPDFSTSFWGYYGTYINSKGEEVKYNKFEREIFRGVSEGEQQNISFSVTNNFEMKTTVDPTDTTDREEKIQLLNLTAGINYNFAADSVRFSPLSLGFRTQVGNWFNLNGNASYTLYDVDEQGRSLRNFLIDEGKGLLRLTNLGFSVSTSLSGEKLKSKEEDTAPPENEFELGQAENRIYKGLYEEKEADFSIPWDISLNYNYNLSRRTPGQSTRYQTLTGGFNFNLTPAWKFSFQGSYDLEKGQFSAPQIRISRDLHCWIMNFTWNPIGTYRGYMFEIRVKAPQLQDLKLTKQNQPFAGR
jgi:lipopolysaccharide assembly outer membrane protein LptD (OstA)